MGKKRGLYITAMWRKGGLRQKEIKTNKSIMITIITMNTMITSTMIILMSKKTWKLVYRRALMVHFLLFIPCAQPLFLIHLLSHTHRARDFVGAA